jgi:hypothetical protein
LLARGDAVEDMTYTHRFPQSRCCLLDLFINLNNSGNRVFINLNSE